MKRTAKGLGLAALLGALVSSCASTGGQTGDEEHGTCWSKLTPLALDAPSPLGFSAQDSLKLAAGTHTSALHWIPAAEFPYGPESGEGQVTVTITSLGNARFATRDGSKVTTELDPCAPSVLSDVSVELDSKGGALHESFQGVLAASSQETATLSATLLGPHLAGSLTFDSAALGERSLVQFVLNLSFGSGSFSGALNAQLEQGHGSSANSAVSVQNVPLACWGVAGAGFAGCSE